MKLFFLTMIMTFITIGCSDNPNTSTDSETEKLLAYTVKLSPSLAPAAYTPIPVNAQLLLDVSTALDPATVTDSSVYIQDVTGKRHLADVTLVGNQIVLQPKVYFTGDTTYEVVVTTDVNTTAGESLSRNAIISFTSGATIDTTSPTLVTTLPSGTDKPEPFGIIYFQFSETLSPLLDPTLLRVYDPVNDLNVLGTTKFSGSLISFTPDDNLTFSKQYIVELNTSSITDLSSNPYNGPVLEDFNFTVTTLANAKPIATYTESNQTLDLNTTVNCIYALDPTVVNATATDLFFGTEDGLKIATFDLNESDFQASTLTVKGSLDLATVGIVYDMELNVTTKRAYLASSKGLFILDINDTNNPLVINQFKTLDLEGKMVPVYGLDVEGSHLYAAATNLGIYDLSILDETNITTLFQADTNGTAFDVVYNDGSLFVSDYNKNFKHFDLNGTLQAPLNPNILGTTHNIISYFDSGNYAYVSMSAAGIRGLGFIDNYTGTYTIGAAATPSYTSQLQRNAFKPDTSFAVLKDLGLVYFSPLSYSIVTIRSYQLLPYEITTAGYIGYSSQDHSVVFVADINGTIHAYFVP